MARTTALSYRALRLPSGELLPIEVRLGRRVLRTILPETHEGQSLLSGGHVQIVDQSELDRG